MCNGADGQALNLSLEVEADVAEKANFIFVWFLIFEETVLVTKR